MLGLSIRTSKPGLVTTADPTTPAGSRRLSFTAVISTIDPATDG